MLSRMEGDAGGVMAVIFAPLGASPGLKKSAAVRVPPCVG